jgi:hypothetical protein
MALETQQRSRVDCGHFLAVVKGVFAFALALCFACNSLFLRSALRSALFEVLGAHNLGYSKNQ